jgi:hypothetical protein
VTLPNVGATNRVTTAEEEVHVVRGGRLVGFEIKSAETCDLQETFVHLPFCEISGHLGTKF